MRFSNILIFLLVLSMSFAACRGSSWYHVPAVVGDADGGLVNVSVKLVPGNGDIYVTTTPFTGLGTQESAITAVNLAFQESTEDELGECDALIKISEIPSAEFVDGPSAGVAITVITYSAIKNMDIRKDASITGAIDEEGRILSIGGVYEKSRAVARKGYNYFLIPLSTMHERVLLVPIKELYDLEIIEVANVQDAIGFLVHNETIEKRDFESMKRELPENLTDYPYPTDEEFKELTEKMIHLENISSALIPETNGEMSEIKMHFTYEIERQNELVEKGYLFSAANEAFLNYIDASTIVNSRNIDTINLNEKVFEIEKCLDSLSLHEKRTGNYEWLIGADIREAWSRDKLDTLNIDDATLAEEKYFYFNELMYADAWCRISKFLEETGGDGPRINESLWETVATERIEEAKNMNITNSDWERHLRCAENLFEGGKYGAAAYDATFVLTMAETDEFLLNVSDDELKETNEKLSEGPRDSVWGRTYHTHGVFMHNSGDERNAYRILTYSEKLDELQNELDESVEKSDSGLIEDEEMIPEEVHTCIAELLMVFVVIIFLMNFKNV